MALEPWAEMVGAPLGSEFLEACERIDPESGALHRKVAREWVASILGDRRTAEVFLLALDGLLADRPSTELIEQRTNLPVAHSAPPPKRARRKQGRKERQMTKDLAAKVILVTGATDGIGKAAATEFANRRATLTIVGRNKEKTEHVLAEIKQ
jgi:hypothetical protein